MIVTLFESVQKAYTRPNQIIDSDWPTIADFLTTFNQCDKKEDMELFNLWQFNQLGELGRRKVYENGQPTEYYETIPGTIRRCKSNAEACWGLVLDFDGEARIDETVQDLAGLCFALYTSFRHTEETHKYRVILPFIRPATQEEIKRKKTSISETFPKVDQASFSESQSFYLHSGLDAKNAIAFWCDGQMIDINMFDDEIQNVPVVRPITNMQVDVVAELVAVMEELKELEPVLSYSDWLKVTFSCMTHVGVQQGAVVMQGFYPEQETGEYNKIAMHYSMQHNAPGIGSLIERVRRHKPNYRRSQMSVVEKTIEEMRRKIRNARRKD
jgi:hypothetical protein